MKVKKSACKYLNNKLIDFKVCNQANRKHRKIGHIGKRLYLPQSKFLRIKKN